MGLVRTKKLGGIRPVKILHDFGGYWQVQYYHTTSDKNKPWEKLEWAPAWVKPKNGAPEANLQPVGAILRKSSVAHFFEGLSPQQTVPVEIAQRLKRLGYLP